MARRFELHEKLCGILGTRNVYFQPPASVKLTYDCIVYKVTNRNDIRADNKQYRDLVQYEVQFIYRDPDSVIPEQIMHEFNYISHKNNYRIDNLHHDVFTIYY